MKSSKKFLMRVLTGALAISMLAGTGICAAAVEDADFEGNAVVTAPDEETQDYVSKLDSIKAMLSQIAQGAYAKLSNTTAAQLIKIAQEAKMSQKIMIEAASQVAAIQSDASTKAAEIMAEAAEAVEGLEDEEQIAQIISQAEEQANAVTKEAEAQSAQIMAEAQAQSDALLADANAQLESIKAQFKGTAAQVIAEVQQKIETAKTQIQAAAAKAGDFVAEKLVKVITVEEGDFTFNIQFSLKGVSAMATAYNGTEEEVTIPAYVKGKIPVTDAKMLSSAANIKTLNFPATMTHISGLCGVMFKELENMNVDEENPYDFAIPEGTKAIGDFAYYMSPMTSLKIPSSVEFIGMRSFGVCENLEEVVIPDSVISLGEGAFQYCANLKKVFIPASVQYVGDLAFADCSDELVIDLETISSQAYVYVRENGIEYNCPLAASISVEPDTSFVEDEEHFSAIELGTTLTITGSADGGSKEGYTYAFYYKREGSTKWTCKQNFKDNDTITLQPAFTGNYQFCVKAKDSTGKVAKMYIDVFVKAAFENTSTISAETIKKGNTVTVNCSTNTNAPTAYAVYYKKNTDAKWTARQNFDENSEVVIKPLKAADYTICVKAKSLEKEYTVSGLQKVATKVSEIPADCLEKMKSGVTDSIKADIAGSYSSDSISFKSADYCGTIILTPKEGSYNTERRYFVVYKVTLTTKYEKNNKKVTEDFTYFTCGEYKNIFILEDGKATPENGFTPYTSGYLSVPNTYASVDGYADDDSLFTKIVTANLTGYDYDDSDIKIKA